MTAKRIRCACGRIYDPVKHKNKCPDCGAEAKIATVAEPPPLPTPEPKPAVVDLKPTPGPPPLPTQFPIPINLQTLLIIGAGAAALILLVLLVRGCGGREKSAQRDRVHAEPGVSPTATAQGPPTVIVIPPKPGPAGGSAEGGDLNAMIANAAAGATVRVPAGLYRGGVVVSRAIKIVGDSKSGGQVIVQSEGKECLSVRSSGVAIQNMQFLGNGIGELAAISVADGTDLDLDGCKVQSGSGVAITVAAKGSIKGQGSTITATNGVGLRLNQEAKANFTQCSFSNSRGGLTIANASTAELHACAFENTGGDGSGAIITINGAKTEVTADDCHFTNNNSAIVASDGASLTVTNSSFKDNGASARTGIGLIAVRGAAHATLTNDTFQSNNYGVLVLEKGVLEMQKCNFDGTGFRQTQQVVAGSLPISVVGQGSTATIRNTVITNSTPYGVSVFSGGEITLEEVEIYGAHTVGLIVGDRNGPSGHAEVKHCKFNRNVTGIGICAGGSADIEDSECRENSDGVIALDRESRAKLIKTALVSNKDFGLYVHGNAEVSAQDCEIQNNAKGAQSGVARKSSERASLTLENCRFGGNRVYGAGAATQSELVLRNCTFDGTDKTNISKEHGAVVQTDAIAGSSPSPEPRTGGTQARRQPTPPPARRPSDQDIYRLIRRFRP